MKLVLEFSDEPEMKHWPCPFAGVGPRVRGWVKDEVTGAMVLLPPIQTVKLPYALRAAWEEGIYRIIFEGGNFTANESDVEVIRPVVIDGETGTRARYLEAGA